MDAWVKIGTRYINLANVCEVRLDERLHSAHVFYVGGGTMEVRDDDADDLRDLLARRATAPEAHRTVFTPAGT